MTASESQPHAMSDHEAEQVARANVSGNTPVVFVHGLWLLASSWDRWAELFDQAGYAPVTACWPDDPDRSRRRRQTLRSSQTRALERSPITSRVWSGSSMQSRRNRHVMAQSQHRPSTDPRDKRLAMAVKDHPLDYADFEGVIPEGNYGAGQVIVWDTGTYRNITEREGEELPVADALADGHVVVWLEGRKLRGGYVLQRVGKDGERERWLLIKQTDEGADARRNPVKDSAGVRPVGQDDRGASRMRSMLDRPHIPMQ
jgi:DNA ligase D-like protein (predicted 3'-phosphoesterase)